MIMKKFNEPLLLLTLSSTVANSITDTKLKIIAKKYSFPGGYA